MTDHVLGKAILIQAAAAASRQNSDQKKLVLAYPDIAARLCKPPLRWTDPQHWTGYIPPARDPERIDGVMPLNTSPVRAALLEILEAAAERADAERPAA